MGGQILLEYPAEISFRGSRRGTVVVREVEVGDALFERRKQHAAGFTLAVDVAEVVPQAQRDFRKENS